MKKRNVKSVHCAEVLRRVERRCDRILSELLILRQQTQSSGNEVDTVIRRLHDTANNLRRQCEIEQKLTRDMFNANSSRS